MKLAIWNAPPAEFAVSALVTGAAKAPFEVIRMRPEECAAQLIQGGVDVALLPATMVLQGAEGFEVVPEVALSTWKYPYARLVLKHGLRGPVRSVACDRRALQEQVVARIVLQEHYRKEPSFVPYPQPEPEALLHTDEDAALLVGNEVPTLSVSEHLTMDLGQEWFELVSYPMVWGLFAARKGRLDPSATQALVRAVQAAEEQRRLWTQAREMPALLHAFYHEDLRLRFDDLVTAGLTELKRYLFFYDVTDEIPSLSFARLPEEEEEPDRNDGSSPIRP